MKYCKELTKIIKKLTQKCQLFKFFKEICKKLEEIGKFFIIKVVEGEIPLIFLEWR